MFQVVNDDGPPSNHASPYVHSLVSTLQAKGHIVSVVLPHVQRSWIGKAHIVGQTLTTTYFRPGTLLEDNGVVSSRPLVGRPHVVRLTARAFRPAGRGRRFL